MRQHALNLRDPFPETPDAAFAAHELIEIATETIGFGLAINIEEQLEIAGRLRFIVMNVDQRIEKEVLVERGGRARVGGNKGRQLQPACTVNGRLPSWQLNMEDTVGSEQSDPLVLFSVVNGMAIRVENAQDRALIRKCAGWVDNSVRVSHFDRLPVRQLTVLPIPPSTRIVAPLM